MKKKLIFVTKALWVGGIETALVNLLGSLDPERYDITCLLLQDEKPMAARLPKTCRLLVSDREHTVSFRKPYRYGRLFHLTEVPEHPSGLHRALMWAVPAVRWVENRLYLGYLRRQMQGKQFDTCVIYSDVAAEAAVRCVSADRYLLYYHHGAMRRVYHDEIGYQKAQAVIAVSEHQKQALKAFRPRYAHKIIAIPNLVNIQEILEKAKFSPGVSFPKDKFNIVTCGRISPEKGMDLAAEACMLLLDRGYQQIHWWIVGGGPSQQALQEQITELGIGDTMTLLGMQENPYPYIAAADLYVQPSRFEGYPVSILEAIILERCILATNNAGASEILGDGTGMLCSISGEALADGAELLLTHPEKRRTLTERAAARELEQENRMHMEQLERLL